MKQDLRVSVTKRMIQEALLGILSSKTLDRVRVNELCEASGVNRSTFYRHYETVYDVLHEIEVRFIEQMPHQKHAVQSREEFLVHLENTCSYFYEHAQLVRVLFANHTDDDLRRYLDVVYEAFLIQQKGELPEETDEDTIKAILAVLGGGCQCLLRRWLFEEIQKTPNQIAQILFQLIQWPQLMGLK